MLISGIAIATTATLTTKSAMLMTMFPAMKSKTGQSVGNGIKITEMPIIGNSLRDKKKKKRKLSNAAAMIEKITMSITPVMVTRQITTLEETKKRIAAEMKMTVAIKV